MQCDRERRAIAEAIDFRRGRIDKRLQIIQTLFIACAARPVNRITAELVRAAQVVNLCASKQIALRVKKQKQSQLSSFVPRIETHRHSVYRKVNAAVAVNYFKVNGHSRSRFKLIADPEAAARCTGAALGYRVVDLCFETGAINRYEVLRLRRDADYDRQHEGGSQDDFFKLVH